MALPELAVAQRQLAIRVEACVEDLDVARTVHRLDRIVAILAVRGEHVVLVVLPVPGPFPEAAIENLRTFDLLITVVAIHLPHVLLDLLPDRPALRMPEHQARRLVLHVEEVEQYMR